MNKAPLRLAAVPVSARQQLEQLRPQAPKQPVVLAARALTKEADPKVQRAGRSIESDHHLQLGSLDRARATALGDARRIAVLDVLEAEGELPWQGLEAVAQSDEPTDRAIALVFWAWAQPGPESIARVTEGLALMREAGASAVARLALAGALAYARTGAIDLALTEALRSLAQGIRSGDEPLSRHAERLIADLRQSSQDARVAKLIEVTLSMAVEDTTHLYERLAGATLQLVDAAQRAFVLIGPHDQLQVVGAAFQPGFDGSPSLSIASTVVLQGREVITREAQDFAVSESIEAMNLRTVLCIPLADGRGILGAIYADSTSATDQELEDVAWLVRAFAAYAAVVAKNTRLLQDAKHSSRNAKEVAHDLCNVASGMGLALDELRELGVPTEALATLRDLEHMNKMLVTSLGGLLEGRTEAHKTVQLQDLVEESVKLMRFQAKAKGVRIALRCEPTEVDGAPEQLARVVANLVGNALKYSDPGHEVRIQVGQRRGTAVIIVGDQGPGIPEDQLATIFESGAQATGARAGHGLGLGICRSIVTAHGGQMHVRNRTAGGAAFTVVLPLP